MRCAALLARGAVLAAAAALGCVAGEAPPVVATIRASNGADAALPTELGPPALRCGAVGGEGCCADEELFWCTDGGLRHTSCALRRSCGWRSRGFYDCDTAGSADPEGRVPKACAWGDAGAPVDLGPPAQDGGCGPVSVEGCCAGEVLLYCARGRVRALSCALNPACGWRGRGQLYECGTAGEADPAALHPRTCTVPAPDLAAELADAAAGEASAAADGGTAVDGDAGAADPAGPQGCSCESATAARGGGAWLALWLLAWIGSPRRGRASRQRLRASS